MKILITNHHLAQMGGTETWVMTMVEELAKEHEVGVYTLNKGYVSDLLKDYLDDKPAGYDLALINHNTCANVDAKFKIFTSHGTEPLIEAPPKDMDAYVAVNENVAKKYNIPNIIKNPINTERFRPTSPIGNKPERILDVTNNAYPYKATRPSRTKNNMPELINQHDLVISGGRGALEAMSCGRPVITWDRKFGWEERGDGYLHPPLQGYVAGPYELRKIDWEEEISKYNKRHGERNRQYILDNHDVRDIVRKYLLLWKTNTRKDI